MNSGLSNQRKAYLYALLAVFFWSTVASAFKLALAHLSFITLLFIASWVSFVALSILVLAGGKWKEIRKSSRKDVAGSFMLGLLNPALYYLILLKAYSVLPAQEAMTLNYTWPLMLVLLSVPLLGQKLSMRGIIALLVSFCGIILIAGRAEDGRYFTNLTGDALAIGSSVIWALFWLYNVRDKRDAIIKLWFGFLFGSVLVSLVWLVNGDYTFPMQGLLPAIYVGLFEMGLTFVFWLKAMQLTSRTEKVSQLIFLSPFLSLFWIQLLLGEHIRTATIAGLALIVAGILIQQGVGRRR